MVSYYKQINQHCYHCYVRNDKKGTFIHVPRDLGEFRPVLIKYGDGTEQELETKQTGQSMIVKIPACYAHQSVQVFPL